MKKLKQLFLEDRQSNLQRRKNRETFSKPQGKSKGMRPQKILNTLRLKNAISSVLGQRFLSKVFAKLIAFFIVTRYQSELYSLFHILVM